MNKLGQDSPFTQFCRYELSPLVPNTNKQQSNEEFEKKKAEQDEEKITISQKKDFRKYETPSPNKTFNQRKTIENLSPYIQSTAQQVVRELEFSNINVKPNNDATYIVLQSPTFKFIFDSKEGYEQFFQIEEDQMILEQQEKHPQQQYLQQVPQMQQQQSLSGQFSKSLFAQEYQQKILTVKKNELFQRQKPFQESFETPKMFKSQFDIPKNPSSTAKKAQFTLLQQSEGSIEHSTSKKKIICNCKKTKCLKLYCECFAAGQTCKDCHCCNCANVPENEEERKLAISQLLERNPEAFKPKVEKVMSSLLDYSSKNQFDLNANSQAAIENWSEQKHTKGCNCKKSNCRKKYCECFQAGVKCSDMCNCTQCKNSNLYCTEDNNKLLDDEDSFAQYGQQSNNTGSKCQLNKDSIFHSPQSFNISNNKKVKLYQSIENNNEDLDLGVPYQNNEIEQFHISKFKDQIKKEII